MTKKRVMAVGAFEILHPGHVHYLTQAKKLGKKLVVVVARDSSIRKFKKREPIMPEKYRLEMVKSLKPVNRAVLGHEGDIFRIVREIKPDIVAVGYDQKLSNEELRKILKQKRFQKIKVVRIKKLNRKLDSTTEIIKRIRKT